MNDKPQGAPWKDVFTCLFWYVVIIIGGALAFATGAIIPIAIIGTPIIVYWAIKQVFGSDKDRS